MSDDEAIIAVALSLDGWAEALASLDGYTRESFALCSEEHKDEWRSDVRALFAYLGIAVGSLPAEGEQTSPREVES